jgi:hypothetical protein
LNQIEWVQSDLFPDGEPKGDSRFRSKETEDDYRKMGKLKAAAMLDACLLTAMLMFFQTLSSTPRGVNDTFIQENSDRLRLELSNWKKKIDENKLSKTNIQRLQQLDTFLSARNQSVRKQLASQISKYSVEAFEAMERAGIENESESEIQQAHAKLFQEQARGDDARSEAVRREMEAKKTAPEPTKPPVTKPPKLSAYASAMCDCARKVLDEVVEKLSKKSTPEESAKIKKIGDFYYTQLLDAFNKSSSRLSLKLMGEIVKISDAVDSNSTTKDILNQISSWYSSSAPQKASSPGEGAPQKPATTYSFTSTHLTKLKEISASCGGTWHPPDSKAECSIELKDATLQITPKEVKFNNGTDDCIKAFAKSLVALHGDSAFILFHADAEKLSQMKKACAEELARVFHNKYPNPQDAMKQVTGYQKEDDYKAALRGEEPALKQPSHKHGR